MTAPGKFDVRPVLCFTSRWDVELRQAMGFNDPVHGLIVVPAGFSSDGASIRVLREVCRWAALLAISGTPFSASWPWLNTTLWVVAVVALALYGVLAGYGLRASILHDWLYTTGQLTRRQSDAVYQRALHTGDGTARWRSQGIFWPGVRLGGYWHYTKTPTRSGSAVSGG